MKIKLKKFPIPWRFSNSKKFKHLDHGQTYTHYIKEPGRGISIYSSDFVGCEGEEKIIRYYKNHMRRPSAFDRIKFKRLIGYIKFEMRLRKIVWKFIKGE